MSCQEVLADEIKDLDKLVAVYETQMSNAIRFLTKDGDNPFAQCTALVIKAWPLGDEARIAYGGPLDETTARYPEWMAPLSSFPLLIPSPRPLSSFPPPIPALHFRSQLSCTTHVCLRLICSRPTQVPSRPPLY